MASNNSMMAPYAPYIHYYFSGLTGFMGVLAFVNPDLMAEITSLEKLAPNQQLWSSLFGVLLLAISNIYVEASLTKDQKLYKLLARGRMIAGGIMLGLVAVGSAGPELLKFGIPDALTGILIYFF